jgi:hypothetical protein
MAARSFARPAPSRDDAAVPQVRASCQGALPALPRTARARAVTHRRRARETWGLDGEERCELRRSVLLIPVSMGTTRPTHIDDKPKNYCCCLRVVTSAWADVDFATALDEKQALGDQRGESPREWLSRLRSRRQELTADCAVGISSSLL